MIQSEQQEESRIGGTQLEGNDTKKPRKRVTAKQEVHDGGDRDIKRETEPGKEQDRLPGAADSQEQDVI